MYGIGEGETLHLFSLAILRFLKALMTEAELIYPYNDLGRKYRRVSTPANHPARILPYCYHSFQRRQ
uniref:Uncharacterized protein n=1 Tax=Ditylenchus dipsaci TaxID=166011 RepID=A0A915DX48_9BILA